jgi:biotin carboxylase
VVLEEFIDGQEVSLNAYLLNGEILCSVLTDRESWTEYPGGIIHRHHFPSRFENSIVHQRILDLAQDVVRIVGLSDGPVYFQIMIQDGRPYLIEVTPRLDGCHLWRLIREVTGVDLLDMTMNHLLYQDPFHRKAYSLSDGSLSDTPVCHLEFYCQAPGEHADYSGFLKEDAIYRFIYYQEGETIKPVNGYMEKCAYRIYR